MTDETPGRPPTLLGGDKIEEEAVGLRLGESREVGRGLSNGLAERPEAAHVDIPRGFRAALKVLVPATDIRVRKDPIAAGFGPTLSLPGADHGEGKGSAAYYLSWSGHGGI